MNLFYHGQLLQYKNVMYAIFSISLTLIGKHSESSRAKFLLSSGMEMACKIFKGLRWKWPVKYLTA